MDENPICRGIHHLRRPANREKILVKGNISIKCKPMLIIR
jgi:hypothetical protein